MKRFYFIIFIFAAYLQSYALPNWEIKKLDSRPIVSICYLGGDTVLIYGQNGLSFKTTNMGSNWVSKNIGISAVNRAYNINQNNAFAIGTAASFGLVCATTNAGTNWHTDFVAGPLGGIDELRCLSVINSNVCYTGGFNFDANFSQYGGTIFKTTNGGTNWNMIFFNPKGDFTDMYFKNEAEGICLDYYRFYKTTNGGTNFIYTGESPIYSYSFTNPYKDTIYICGTEGRIARSTNNGANWNVYYMTETTSQLNRIFAVDSKTVYVCGDSAKIFKTTNAGNNWIDLSINKEWKLKDVNFLNANTGFIVGDSGRVLKTTTGGVVFVSNQNANIPDNFKLEQNYPNPFNPNTVISYQLKVAGNISLNIYDINGKLIKVLDNGYKREGSYSTNFSGEGLSSGIYYYSLYTDGVLIDTKKAILLK